MPGILIAFWALLGLGSGLALADKQAPVWGRVDRSAHSHGRIDKPTPYAWLSSAPHQIARRDIYGEDQCTATAFAVTGGGRVLRVEIDGQEQELGTSWSKDVTAATHERRVITVRYRNPVGGAELACYTLAFICEPETGWDGRVKVSPGGGEPCK